MLMAAVLGVLALAPRTDLSARGADGTTVTVVGVPPGSVLEVAINGGKPLTSAAGPSSDFESILDFANAGKPKVTVYVDRCEDGKVVRVLFVVEGNAEPPKDDHCDRKMVGWFWGHRAKHVTIDVASGGFHVSNGPPTKILVIAGGAAAAGIGIAAGSGGSPSAAPPVNNTPQTNTPTTPTTPTTPAAPSYGGTYAVSSAVKLDPWLHAIFVQLANAFQLNAAVTNASISFTGSSDSNFIAVNGTIVTSTGAFDLTGTGVAAGRTNVGVRLTGMIDTSGHLTAEYIVGTPSGLPNGPITYTITGQKQ
jgi:hypothetical protein